MAAKLPQGGRTLRTTRREFSRDALPCLLHHSPEAFVRWLLVLGPWQPLLSSQARVCIAGLDVAVRIADKYGFLAAERSTVVSKAGTCAMRPRSSLSARRGGTELSSATRSIRNLGPKPATKWIRPDAAPRSRIVQSATQGNGCQKKY